MLAARRDLPAQPRAFALFAHCFTHRMDIFAASRIAEGLASRGIAVLRFDFTSIGGSEGELANTNFSTNVGDLLTAVAWLRQNHGSPSLLIGHSLGGAAVLAAAPDVPDASDVVTIGALASAAHGTHNFAANLEDIVEKGTAEVTAGRQSAQRSRGPGHRFYLRCRSGDGVGRALPTEMPARVSSPLIRRACDAWSEGFRAR